MHFVLYKLFLYAVSQAFHLFCSFIESPAPISPDGKSDIEARDGDGMTPLLLAVANGSNRVLKLLLERGAQASTLNKKDQTVIHLAAKNNLPATLKVRTKWGQAMCE